MQKGSGFLQKKIQAKQIYLFLQMNNKF